MEKCWVVDCEEMGYEDSYVLQKKLILLRNKGLIPDVLLLLEHPPLITMGPKSTEDMLRVPRRVLEQRGIPVFNTTRGGKVTYHGPGQVVGYAIRKIDMNQLDNHMLGLEDAMLKLAVEYGINAQKSYDVDDKHKRLPGIWCIVNGKEAKLGSVGIEVREGVTMHGFALNVNTNLEHFDFIDLCGFKDKKATSMQKVLGRPIPVKEIKQKLGIRFGNAFKYMPETKSYVSFIDAVNKTIKNINSLKSQE